MQWLRSRSLQSSLQHGNNLIDGIITMYIYQIIAYICAFHFAKNGP